ncbi:MAG: Gfo/Idh/MocA family oxidoreductase [Candidatus Hydrogenedentes bacterium]|nr:Gfo/Idh/MocA family oxidoreductase [Candidatus Hydrogenedentota bacterium]
MLNVGLIGYGYWGPNLARNFDRRAECRLAQISDMRENRRALAKAAFPHTEVVDDERILAAPDIDVMVIATPVFTHFDLAKKALLNGKHVWIEKPMTSNSEQARELVELAESKGLTLMVDHTFLFTGAVQKMKELVDSGELGDLYYYDSVRINLGLFQHDINVIWDLAPHDLSIMDYLLGPSVRAVSAQGSDHFKTGFEDVAYVNVFYDNNLMAHFSLNWLSPVKIRRTIVGGAKKMLVWDDVSQEEKIKIYNKGMEVTTREGVYRILATPRVGDMTAPVISNTEALATEVDYFISCIREKKRPINDGHAGLRVVSILEATDQSLREGGKIIELSSRQTRS